MRLRTGYSFHAATGPLDKVMSRLVEIGTPFAPISDRNNTFAFTSWTKEAKKNNLKPIYGVELAVVPQLGLQKPPMDFWAFFAVDNIRQLNELIYKATKNSGCEPSLTYGQALRACREGIIGISGERTLLDKCPPTPNFFVGLMPSSPKGLIRDAAAMNHRFMMSGDNYYTREDDLEFYRVALGRRSGTQTYPRHILTMDEWRRATEWLAPPYVQQLAIENMQQAAELCRAELKTASLFKPPVAQTLREMCVDGARLKGCDLTNPVYAERLERELGLIAEKAFEDYFFIIADMVQWAKQNMIVGPARGSSCGSLVCYLLDITAIDPLPYDLIFERFIDTTRKDLPDIDLDFSDVQRHKVFEYVEQKYGLSHVARLGTVGTFAPRSAIKGAAAALQVPAWKVDKVLDSLILRSSGDSRALQQLEDTLNDTPAGRLLKSEHPQIVIAAGMEGHPASSGQHAAGVIITSQPVLEYVAVDARTNAAMCDKYDAEVLNLLKIDALGLTQLSVFERTLELAGIKDWRMLERLPLDDPKAFEVLNSGHFCGIFQFMGVALKSITKQITVNHVEDLIAITALARPGPIASGGANTWVKRRNGVEPITYPHPLFEPHLRTSLGTVIYQEQVMNIGRHVGDLSWDDVTALRKAMSKSLGKEYFNQYGDRWKAGARAKGIPSDVLDRIWDDMCAYGSWSFNRSHAVAYGLVSYWCCWLKAHYPLEFAAATLDAEHDPTKQIAMLRELDAEGVTYRAIDPDHSSDRWAIADGKLIGPLTLIKGVGPAALREIMEARRAGKQPRASIKKKLLKAKTDIDSLTPVEDMVKKLYPDLTVINIISTPTPIINVQTGIRGQVLIIGIAKKITPRDENEPVLVAKRNGKVKSGPTRFLNMFINDDTDEIFVKIDRFSYERLGKKIVEDGRPGKSIYAFLGFVPPDFRMITVKNVRYIGEMDTVLAKKDTSTTHTGYSSDNCGVAEKYGEKWLPKS